MSPRLQKWVDPDNFEESQGTDLESIEDGIRQVKFDGEFGKGIKPYFNLEQYQQQLEQMRKATEGRGKLEAKKKSLWEQLEDIKDIQRKKQDLLSSLRKSHGIEKAQKRRSSAPRNERLFEKKLMATTTQNLNPLVNKKELKIKEEGR